MTDQLLPTIETLYRARLADFVAERKRLANELKAAGDKQLSGRVAKLGRPSVSAWAVNQLWWHERETFEALLGAAARMKNGVPQPNGTLAPEPTMNVDAVARAVLYMASLPLDANVLSLTVMATKMPFVGRG